MGFKLYFSHDTSVYLVLNAHGNKRALCSCRSTTVTKWIIPQAKKEWIYNWGVRWTNGRTPTGSSPRGEGGHKSHDYLLIDSISQFPRMSSFSNVKLIHKCNKKKQVVWQDESTDLFGQISYTPLDFSPIGAWGLSDTEVADVPWQKKSHKVSEKH